LNFYEAVKVTELDFFASVGEFVESIYDTSMTVPFIPMEDVFFTGIIAGGKLKLNLHGDRKFRVSSIPIHYPCIYL
jgi:hypothetical protein